MKETPKILKYVGPADGVFQAPSRFGPGFQYKDPCVASSGIMRGVPDPHWPCRSGGKHETSVGRICGRHLRMWAKREWVDPDEARVILLEVAENRRQEASRRVACLKKGECV